VVLPEADLRRLILFDIDGTLLTAQRAPRRAFERAMIEVYGTAGPIATHAFDGKTDPQIARELLELDGVAAKKIDDGLDALWRTYLRELQVEFARADHATLVLPGVVALLAELEKRSDSLLLGLLTGNIHQGAALKLASARITTTFRLGAYGSDDERRDRLPPVAVQRAHALTGRTFDGHDVVIIGDTPHDVTCGRDICARAVGVATGRYSAAELRAAGAVAVLSDLSDTDAALHALLAGEA
jgi:phosphoglycolate phosphatase